MRKILTSGLRFGRLIAIKRVKNGADGNPLWLCRCDCGNEKIIRSNSLFQGHTRSCGCLQSESGTAHAPLCAAANTTHGMSGTRLNSIFKGMVSRCTNKNNRAYKDYGGRGISVCAQWMKDRGAFFSWAKKNGYRKGLTIDRIKNHLGYSPNNCRWATAQQQANNTRRNRVIEFEGRSMTLAQWADKSGIEMRTLWQRLKSGWDFKRAITVSTKLKRYGYGS